MDTGTVFIVDDEEAVRDSIAMLLRSVGLRSQLFADATSFLRQYRSELAGCLVLDVRMPRMSGLELQQELNRRGWTLPVIFITGHGDVPMAVEAMRAGALDFLQKPFKDDDLIRRVQKALDQDARERAALAGRDQLRQHFEELTPREREVARRIVAGQANKAVALDLGLSERTVELHRAHVMQKMEARNLAQLVQMLLQVDSA
ncbi:DNA-binding response regulator [Stagnimonas aquatica]|uniref:DNA-binding response regulator n=1 Tax=Stagnimonas aquatica TaxID=2689987 RepID=A0A3N0VLA8_9GAMM|nr:response regulator [Stagnimonas aquatica]ROH93542.1 DNA-binding response regulator [Stagnimonas aquatica]